MKIKTCFATIFLAVLCLLTSGCFSIEQEIFLEPDGSGDMVIFVSMPDIPEAMIKKGSDSPQDLQKLIDDIKQKFATELPPAIKLKEAKEVHRHGAMAFYIVLHFNQLNDVDSMLNKFSKESLSEKGQAQSLVSKDESLWKIQLEKAGDMTVITQRFYADMLGAMEGAMGQAMGGAMEAGKPESAKAPSDSAPSIKPPAPVTPKSGSKLARKGATRRTASGAKPVPPKEENPFESILNDPMKGPMKELMNEVVLSMVLSSICKLRFVLHAPKNITETNADIVLNGRIAIWNASFGAFAKEKKPIEMKVTY